MRILLWSCWNISWFPGHKISRSLHLVNESYCLPFPYVYTGWPRKNATTSIINFKDIVNKTDFFVVVLLGRKLIFQQNDTTIINFGWGILILGLFYAMSFSEFATFSTLAILGTARIFRFTASRRINCCVMNSSVCSHCLRFQSKCSVSVRDAVWGGNVAVFQSTMGSKKYKILKMTLPH